ncbi:tyrosine-type recombinase/integrase [Fibrella arboris]|uniref:tyrosine-type recombinase/integrase n=1 Tax=Fibrella arboris TaxID=3242486 RepID=UPI00351F8D3D
MSTSHFQFRKDSIDALPPRASRYHVADHKIPGLQLAVYPSGIKTFIVYRKIDHSPERIKIGRYPDLTIEQARTEAKRLMALIALGQNPHKDRVAARQAMTFLELYDLYYTHHALKFTKRPDANKKMMACQVFPVLGQLKADKITPEHIRNFHTKLGQRYAGSTANRLINIISAVFNFGVREKYIQSANPCIGLRKYKSVSRDRFLSFDELDAFYAALEQEDNLFKDFFRLLLYTGARKSNVLSMAWSDLNLDLRRWRIGETQTKNRDVNIVPLSELALAILRRRDATNKETDAPSPFVFPGASPDGYLKDPKRAFDRIRERMQAPDIRMHDLRRTLGSYMAIGGASLPIIGKALNHKSQVSTAIYARLSNDPVLEAVNQASTLMHKRIIP